jgi:flagellar hook-associated protein 1 FlgK
MPDMMSSGLSSLRALQRALDTTSNNIANANTEGYSRQRVEFRERQASPFGNGWVGNGVEVASITRSYDEFLVAQSRASGGGLERLSAYASQAERINNLLGDPNTGLSASMQRLSNAIQSVATTPASIPARQTLLAEGDQLVERLRGYDARLRELDAEINTRFQNEARDVTNLARSIAQLNGEINSAFERTGQPPNELLDQRDRLIDQLSKKVNVSVAKENGTTLNVFIGNGQALVLGTNASEVTVIPDRFEPNRAQLALRTTAGVTEITGAVSGGTLGGLVDFRREMLDPTRNTLGRIAVAVAEQMNATNRQGIDLTGAMGSDLFAIGGVGVAASGNNTDTGTVTATRTGVGALTEANYYLERTSSGYQLTRADTGAVVSMTGTGVSGDPFVADGLSLVIGGSAAVGDRFVIRPTRDAVAGFALTTTDPQRIAAASPIRTGTASANAGGATISAGDVVDATDPALRSAVTIEFTSPTTYSINGSGSFAYTSGTPISLNGWTATISGTPAVGDRFTVSDNTGGRGDNRNALKLADALAAPVLDSGTASLGATIDRLTATIGLQTRSAQTSRDAQAIVNRDDIAARESVSGVNLDEEAANLLRYQKAYQAAAQIIAIAGELLDTLLAATRR